MAKVFNLPDNFKLSSPKTWFRIAQPAGNSTQLSRKHIYILPTRFGWLYTFILIALLLGSINYSLSLGFAMTFLLAGFGSISMLHTWRNLANLKVVMRRAKPVFAGEVASFELIVMEESARHASRTDWPARPLYRGLAPGFANARPTAQPVYPTAGS